LGNERRTGAVSFFLPDALGSVRQVADVGGNVLLAQSFDPFRNLLMRSGALTSYFGYAGEWTGRQARWSLVDLCKLLLHNPRL
jgi:hypothetical protein